MALAKFNHSFSYDFMILAKAILMITKRDGMNVTTIKLYTINGIITSDDNFCSEVERWMQNSISTSLSLSGHSSRERFQFFHKLKSGVNYLLETKKPNCRL